MRKLLAFFLSLLLTLPLAGCGEKDAAEYFVTRRYILEADGDIQLTDYAYDENWNLLASTVLLNGEFVYDAAYSYSEDFTLVTITTRTASNDSGTTEVHRTFDENGNVRKALAYEDGDLTTETEYTYDAEGHEIKAVVTASPGYVNTVEHIFDKNGNLVAYLTDNGFTVSRQEFSYDRQNRRTGEASYQNGQLAERAEYTYENGVQKGIHYDASGKQLRTTFVTFDDASNPLTEEAFDLQGTLLSRTCYAYQGTDGSVSSGIPE